MPKENRLKRCSARSGDSRRAKWRCTFAKHLMFKSCSGCSKQHSLSIGNANLASLPRLPSSGSSLSSFYRPRSTVRIAASSWYLLGITFEHRLLSPPATLLPDRICEVLQVRQFERDEDANVPGHDKPEKPAAKIPTDNARSSHWIRFKSSRMFTDFQRSRRVKASELHAKMLDEHSLRWVSPIANLRFRLPNEIRRDCIGQLWWHLRAQLTHCGVYNCRHPRPQEQRCERNKLIS